MKSWEIHTTLYVSKMKSLDELIAWASFQHKKSYDSKKTKMTSLGKDVEKREPLCTVGGNVN